jgi:hypothetical protein
MSVCLLGTTRLPLNNFHEIWYLSIFLKYVEKILTSLNSDTILYMNTNIHFWLHLTHFFLEWEMFQIKVSEKIKIHILCSIMFIKKLYHLWDNVEKYGTAGEATRWQYGVCAFHAGYLRLQTHSLRICNTNCFSTATMVAQMCLNVALYVPCLSYHFYSMSGSPICYSKCL